MSWTRLTPEQKARAAAFAELATFFPLDGPARPSLNREEANGIKLSVSRRLGTDVTTEFVHETYVVRWSITVRFELIAVRGSIGTTRCTAFTF